MLGTNISDPSNSPERFMWLPSFYWWGNWGSSEIDFPKNIQLRGGAGIQSQVYLFPNPKCFSPFTQPHRQVHLHTFDRMVKDNFSSDLIYVTKILKSCKPMQKSIFWYFYFFYMLCNALDWYILEPWYRNVSFGFSELDLTNILTLSFSKCYYKNCCQNTTNILVERDSYNSEREAFLRG